MTDTPQPLVLRQKIAATRLWHGAIAALVAFALISTTVTTIRDDTSMVNLWSYFTVQSNLLVMVAAALIAWRPDIGGAAFGILRLGGLVGITITGIVFATVLAGEAELDGLAWWNDKIFHYVVPVMAVIGFVVFRPRTRLDRSSLWFVAWPVVWLAYTLVRAGVSDPKFPLGDGTTIPVPYDFLNYDAHGALAVTIASLVVTAMALLIAWAYLTLSRRDRVNV